MKTKFLILSISYFLCCQLSLNAQGKKLSKKDFADEFEERVWCATKIVNDAGKESHNGKWFYFSGDYMISGEDNEITGKIVKLLTKNFTDGKLQVTFSDKKENIKLTVEFDMSDKIEKTGNNEKSKFKYQTLKGTSSVGSSEVTIIFTATDKLAQGKIMPPKDWDGK